MAFPQLSENPFARLRTRSAVMGDVDQTDPTQQAPGPMDEIPRPTKALGPIDRDPSQQSDEDNYYADMARLRGYHPVTDQYKQTLLSAPQSKDFKPTKMRTLGAALAGGLTGAATRDPRAAMSAANEVSDQPYDQAVKDFSTRIGALGEGSRLEQTDTENQIKNIAQARALGLSYAKFNAQREHEGRQDDAAATNAAARMQTAGKKHYTGQQMKNGVRMVNDGDPRDTYDLPGQTLQQVNADIASGRLKVDQRNAATAEGRLGLARDVADKNDIATRYRLFQGDQRIKLLNKGVKVADQDRARSNVLRGMATDPVFGKYIDSKTSPNFPEIAQGISPQKYQALKEEITKRMAQSLRLTQDDLDQLLADDPDDDSNYGDDTDVGEVGFN